MYRWRGRELTLHHSCKKIKDRESEREREIEIDRGEREKREK
jgi:hypothetical protein